VNIYEMLGHELRFVRTAAVNGPATEDFNLHFLPSNSELVIRFESFMGEDRAYYSNPDPVLISGGYNFSTPVNLNLVPKSGCTYKKIEIILVDINHNHIRYSPKLFPGYYRRIGHTAWQSAYVYNNQSYIVNPEEGFLYQTGISYKGSFRMKEVAMGKEDVVIVEIEID